MCEKRNASGCLDPTASDLVSFARVLLLAYQEFTSKQKAPETARYIRIDMRLRLSHEGVTDSTWWRLMKDKSINQIDFELDSITVGSHNFHGVCKLNSFDDYAFTLAKDSLNLMLDSAPTDICFYYLDEYYHKIDKETDLYVDP